MDDRIFNYIKNNLPNPLALLVGYLGILILIITPLETFLDNYISFNWIKLILYILILLIWTVVWLVYRTHFPKTEASKIGVVISILTENDKQKLRLKNDLLKRLNEQARSKGLDNKIDFIYLNEHQSQIHNNYVANDRKKWEALNKKIKGNFYIYGNIKERTDIDNKYYLTLEATVTHKPLTRNATNSLQTDFFDIWARQINFSDKFEFRGFTFSADMIFIGTLYISGLASLYSREFELAYELHKDLENEFNKFNPIPPNLGKIKKKLSDLLAEETFLLARNEYENNSDLKSAEKYIEKSLSYKSKNYGPLLLKSIIELSLHNNPSESLKTVTKCSKYSHGDGTWKYNKAFLLMYLGRYQEALRVYENISKYTYEMEHIALNQVYSFNLKLVENDTQLVFPLFILGFLKFHKSSNFPESLEYFESLIEKAKNDSQYRALINKANEYIAKCKEMMKL